MNDDLFDASTRSLPGDPHGPLRVPWRRSAALAGRAQAPTRTRPIISLGAMLATMALAALGAMTLGGTLIDAKAVTGSLPAGTDAPLAQRHAQAVQAFRSQRYAIAYGAFATLADAGHAPSAAIALTLASQGGWLLGSHWSVTPGQLQRWNTLAQHDLYEHASLLTDHERGE